MMRNLVVLVIFGIGMLTVQVHWRVASPENLSQRACCAEPVKDCLACQEGKTIREFCVSNAGKYECHESRIECCGNESKECVACSQDLTVEDLCTKYPGQYSCHIPACCDEETKECLACRNRQTVEQFCEGSPGIYGCPRRCCYEKRAECFACEEDIPEEEFCSKNPGCFGCRGDIMLGIYLNNKIGITKFTASVIREYHHITESDLYLFDDASAQYSEEAVRSWYGKGVNYYRSNVTTGTVKTTRKILEIFVQSKYKTIFLIDSETVFLSNWGEFIQSYIGATNRGLLSLYHSSVNHNYTVDCEEMAAELCKDGSGLSTGYFAVALTHTVAEAILTKGPNGLSWHETLKDSHGEILYPTKSLTMQIGQHNQGEDNCGENEVAYRFDRCKLPYWVKSGIEFYFDRCTSPDELYFPEYSSYNSEKEGRFWVRPVISYSLYGSNRRYIEIARENVARVFSIYPGWKVWIYSDRSVPRSAMDKLCEFDVRFVDMSHSKITSKMSWRFLVASEPVKMYAIRDIDSWLLPRGKAAVDEWIKSGRKFHVMRDHPHHSLYPMNGGMWGGTHDAVPNMKDLLESKRIYNFYMQDMRFLNNIIWKMAQKSVWAHDSHSLHKYGEDHPFPTELESPDKFVGNVIIYEPSCPWLCFSLSLGTSFLVFILIVERLSNSKCALENKAKFKDITIINLNHA